VGVAAIIAAWFYTGGKKPYGYLGLGEGFVFIFFGLVAVLGTTYTQADTVSGIAWAGAIGTALVATALWMANNVRDVPTDAGAAQVTLAVILLDTAARCSCSLMLAVAVAARLFFIRQYPPMAVMLVILVISQRPSILIIDAKAHSD